MYFIWYFFNGWLNWWIGSFCGGGVIFFVVDGCLSDFVFNWCCFLVGLEDLYNFLFFWFFRYDFEFRRRDCDSFFLVFWEELIIFVFVVVVGMEKFNWCVKGFWLEFRLWFDFFIKRGKFKWRIREVFVEGFSWKKKKLFFFF